MFRQRSERVSVRAEFNGTAAAAAAVDQGVNGFEQHICAVSHQQQRLSRCAVDRRESVCSRYSGRSVGQ